VDTPGGRYYAEFDLDAPVTREGQLIFFAQFLHTGGRWARLLEGCPLRYFGNRGSGACNVVGTAALSILCGHWRYAHINALRGDTLNPPLLGMTRVVSEDVVRRALKRIEETEGLRWLAGELRASVEPVLSQPWILDIDVTVKPLYGHQQGAQIGHNPHKPGRPSHTYHSYFMANTRLCLGVEARGGKEHAARHGLPGLWSLLEALPRTHWPAFIRGDCGYGNEVLLSECEARGLPCFFKLRHTAKVKTLLAQVQRAGGAWQDAGEGWEVIEARLRLSGWSAERRVVLVREKPALAPVGAQARRRRDPFAPALPGADDWQHGAALARPPASLLWAVSSRTGEVSRWSGGGLLGGGWRWDFPRQRPSAARSRFPPSPRGGERRGFGGGAPIRPVRLRVPAISWCFWSGTFPLRFFRGRLLLQRAICYPQAAHREACLHGDLFVSWKRNDRAQSIHRSLFGPKGGGGREPFQSVVKVCC
jgi:hypothetical protein